MTGLARGVAAAAEAVMAAAGDLNLLDAQAGDGDLGVTMATASKAALETVAGSGASSPADLLRACGAAIAQKAPSTAGTLIATGLLRAAKAVSVVPELDPAHALAAGLDAARTGIADRGKAELGSKTMLDSLGPAADAALHAADAGLTSTEVLAAATDAAEAGAQATASMRPRHGRAGWLAERSAGHEDGGARLVAIILGAAATSMIASEGAL